MGVTSVLSLPRGAVPITHPRKEAPGAALAGEVPGRRAELEGAGTIWEQGAGDIQHSADRDSGNSSGSWGSQQLLDEAPHPSGSCWTGAGDASSCWIPQQNPSGSCWVSLEQPRAGKGSAGFDAGSAGAGELWGLSWAGAGCIPCRINPFLTHS